MLENARQYYKKFYTSSNVISSNLENYFSNVKPETTLSDNDRKSCDGYVSYDECKQAIFSMRKNKSPGLDGISIEFYQTFAEKLIPILTDVLNKSYDNNKLPDSQRISVMSLFLKRKIDRIWIIIDLWASVI